MGGILESAEIDGFLGNRDLMISEVDVEAQEWRVLVDIWGERYKERPVKSSDIVQLCAENELLDSVLGKGTSGSRRAKLGRALSTRVGRRLGSYRITKDTSVRRSSARYCLVQVSPSDDTEQCVNEVSEA